MRSLAAAFVFILTMSSGFAQNDGDQLVINEKALDTEETKIVLQGPDKASRGGLIARDRDSSSSDTGRCESHPPSAIVVFV